MGHTAYEYLFDCVSLRSFHSLRFELSPTSALALTVPGLPPDLNRRESPVGVHLGKVVLDGSIKKPLNLSFIS